MDESLTQIEGLKSEEKALIVKDIKALDGEVLKFKITDQPSRERGSILLSSIKKMIKKIQEKRDAIVKPIKQSIALIDNDFKTIMQPLSNMEISIKAEITRDYNEQEKIRIEAERKAREEIAKQEKKLQERLNSENEKVRERAENKLDEITIKAEMKVPEVQTNISTSVGSTAVRKIWKFEVTDFSKVPDRYKTIHNTAVNEAIRSGERIIPGIKIYQETVIAGR